MEPSPSHRVMIPVRFATSLVPCHRRFGRGKTIVSVISNKPSPSRLLAATSPPTKPSPSERQLAREREGTPLPDSKGELPPIIRRTEVVAIALVGLLIICHRRRASILPRRSFCRSRWPSSSAPCCRRPPASSSATAVPRAVGGRPDRHGAQRRVAFMVGLIAVAGDGMEQQAAGARCAAEGKAARVRPAARRCGRNCRACSAAPTR